MNILVTGGAGYIGAVTVKKLLEEGHSVVVYDNLAYGHKESVPCKLIVGDLLDNEFLNSSLGKEKIDAVIHFAAYSQAGESMKKPYKYLHNNVVGCLNLLEFMQNSSIRSIVFSSTSAIFGTPKKVPISEEELQKPESVYGESKLMCEKLLKWYDKIYGIRYSALRYFNAAGAALDGLLGEDHSPESHLIPVAIQAALSSGSKTLEIFGNDYPTEDGTCIRDYIHVEDLAEAHVLTLKYLQETQKSDSFNLGTGRGYSVQEVVEMVKKVSGVDFPVKIGPRREGDPPIVYADNKKAEKILGFDAKHSDLETVVKTALVWQTKNSK